MGDAPPVFIMEIENGSALLQRVQGQMLAFS